MAVGYTWTLHTSFLSAHSFSFILLQFIWMHVGLVRNQTWADWLAHQRSNQLATRTCQEVRHMHDFPYLVYHAWLNFLMMVKDSWETYKVTNYDYGFPDFTRGCLYTVLDFPCVLDTLYEFILPRAKRFSWVSRTEYISGFKDLYFI
jgi:hypothetical protein